MNSWWTVYSLVYNSKVPILAYVFEYPNQSLIKCQEYNQCRTVDDTFLFVVGLAFPEVLCNTSMVREKLIYRIYANTQEQTEFSDP